MDAAQYYVAMDGPGGDGTIYLWISIGLLVLTGLLIYIGIRNEKDES